MLTAFRMEFDRRVVDKSITAEPEQAEVVAALERLSTDIETQKSHLALAGSSADRTNLNGVYIWGRVGRGKSMLMNLFYDLTPVVLKRRLHFHAFMAEVHASMQPPPSEKEEPSSISRDPITAAADNLKKRARLLCLDEFEITDIADAMIVGRLFDRLFEQGLVLVATSNEDPDHLYNNGPNRELFTPFVDRLKQHVQVVELRGGRDHRSDDSGGNVSRYLCPISKENVVHFDLLWTEALAGAQETPSSFRLHGRDVEVSRACDHQARVTFEEVCQRAMSADDHLAFSRKFTNVFLEGLPRIDAEHVDDGRRLVTLIDALYESRALLTVLAAIEPGEIFEDLKSDDHQRTMSRLNEMRDTAWSRQQTRV